MAHTPAYERTLLRVTTFGRDEFSGFRLADSSVSEKSSKLEVEFRREGVLRLTAVSSIQAQPSHPQAVETYSTENNIRAYGPLINPTGVRKWSGFYAWTVTPKGGKEGVETVTSVKYRLNAGDDATDFYWNGAAWVAVVPMVSTQWNTLAEIQAGIPSFSVAAQKLRVVYNLKTTDKFVTPKVGRSVVSFECDVPSFKENIIYRTFVPRLKNSVRGLADMVIPFPVTGTALSLAQVEAVEQDEPLPSVKSIEGVYNYTTDSSLLTNLIDSTANDGTVTLTGSIAAGTNTFIRVGYQPSVQVVTHPDYHEISAVPAILIENISEEFVSEGRGLVGIVNVTDNTAIAVTPPRQVRYSMTLVIVAARNLELLRLVEAVETSLRRDPMLRSSTVDEKISVVISEPVTTSPSPGDSSHVHEARIEVELWGANKWIHTKESSFGVSKLNLDGDFDEDVIP